MREGYIVRPTSSFANFADDGIDTLREWVFQNREGVLQ
jgi:hypothetical protein